MIFWGARFLFGHKLVWLRCKFRLHKYDEWDLKQLHNVADEEQQSRLEIVQRDVLDQAEAQGRTLKTHPFTRLSRFCVDCGEGDKSFFDATIEVIREDDGDQNRLVTRHRIEKKHL